MKPKSIVLLSGGLDSTVSAAIAKQKTRVLFALTLDYGQRAARMEIKASRKIAQALRLEHKIVKLPFFKEFNRLKMITSNKKRKKPQSLNRLTDVWIPNRNGLFINIAACYAEYYGAQIVVTGFNRDEASEFPDNRPQFIAAINHSLFYSTRNRVKVQSFISNHSKKQIYQLGKKYNAPLRYIYSCYLGEAKMCGRCASCKRLQQALK